MSLSVTDLFCGAGGEAQGLTEAGLKVVLGANHWARAIETHAANFPHAEHLCVDIDHYDMRRLPKTDILWASPICTEISPAGGQTGYKRPAASKAGQTDMLIQELGYVSQPGFERTRATFHDVIRAAEVHRYSAVIVENVPEVVDRWELFDWWVEGMCRLGYQAQFISVTSAHVGDADNDPAAQWRCRLFIVFTRIGAPLPDLELRPRSYCATCERDVEGRQTWAPSTKGRRFLVGKYRRIPDSNYGQYWYTCDDCGKRCEPYILPAASAIDWSDLGTPIAELDEPLKPNTMRRIREGIETYGQPVVSTVAGNTFERAGYNRSWPAFGAPLNTRSCTNTDALTIPPMLVPCGGRWNDDASSATGEPMRTRMANEKGHEALWTSEPFIAMLRKNGGGTSIREPLATFAAGGTHHALIVPYYTKGKARGTDQPLDTVTVRDRFAMVKASNDDAMQAHYRMLKPRESLNAQRFPGSYIVTGNIGEQTMQAGNAVSANVAHWIGRQVMAALDSAGAR